MAKAKKISPEEAKEDLKKRKHHVEESAASLMVKKYQSFRTKLATAKKNEGPLPAKTPDLPVSLTYNKKAIQALLKKPGAAGVRIYPAINSDNYLTLVLVSVDENGENIVNSALAVSKSASATGSSTIDEGQMSPPYPASKTI